MSHRGFGLIVAAALMGAAFSASAAEDYVTNAAEIVKVADWKQMQTVTIKIGEHDYAPDELKLKLNTPYKIALTNTATKPHYWTAPKFFRSVATRKVQTAEAEIKAPYFDAIEVNPKGTAELFVVPVKAGVFEVFCTIEDHREKGMEGKIVVE